MVEIKFKDYTVITDEDGSIHDVLFKEDSRPMLMLGSGRFIHHMLAEIVRLRKIEDEATTLAKIPLAKLSGLVDDAARAHELHDEIVRLRGLLDAAQPAIAQSDCIWARNGNAACPAKVKGGA
jgi:hypothetical protein